MSLLYIGEMRIGWIKKPRKKKKVIFPFHGTAMSVLELLVWYVWDVYQGKKIIILFK